jgi:thioesterase domain-containing protein
MELIQKLKRDVEIQLPMAALVLARSVSRLASVLAQPSATAESSFVELKAGGRAIHLVHPSGGGVLCYLDLSRRLGDHGVRAFQARGLFDGLPPFGTIEEMAAEYVKLLKKKEPGPYSLGGWSMGGVVAYEMAQQLTAAGDDVKLVAMLDSWLPSHVAWPKDEAGLAGWFMRDLAGLEGVNVAANAAIPDDPTKQLAYVLDRLKDLKAIPALIRPDQVKPLFEVFKANIRALRAYQAKPYARPVALLRATTQLESFVGATDAWGTIASSLTVFDVPGTHYDIVRPPALTTLSTSLSALLDR